MNASREVQEKAQRLIAENRVTPVKAHGCIVAGDSGSYYVYASPKDVRCTCPAKGECSHILAAMAFWGDDVGV